MGRLVRTRLSVRPFDRFQLHLFMTVRTMQRKDQWNCFRVCVCVTVAFSSVGTTQLDTNESDKRGSKTFYPFMDIYIYIVRIFAYIYVFLLCTVTLQVITSRLFLFVKKEGKQFSNPITSDMVNCKKINDPTYPNNIIGLSYRLLFNSINAIRIIKKMSIIFFIPHAVSARGCRSETRY